MVDRAVTLSLSVLQVVLAAVLAVAAAKPTPGLLAYSAVPAVHSGVVAAAPVAYSAPAVAYSAPAVAYSAPAVSYSAPAVSYAAPAVAYSAPVAAPVAYSVPAAHSYVSGYNVAVHAEPVEQHGYKIVY